MNEQDRANKLKARMSRWQEYVDRPQADTVQQTAASAEMPTESHESLTVRQPNNPPVFVLEPARETASGHEDIRTNAPSGDPVADIQEARIADLTSAIARERKQADRLADEVKRVQMLHAATLYSHHTAEKDRHAALRAVHREIFEAPPVYYGETRRKNLVFLACVLLVITSVLVMTFFMTR